jgi:threonine dehydrogenase-like Zn-dependent dehydrogenase
MSDCSIVFTARERAELVAAPPPAAELAPDGVVVKTIATLVSAGTELNMQYVGREFPAHPGYAAAGRVERVGSEVADLEAGDLVFFMGRHQSRSCHPRQKIIELPRHLEPLVAPFARLMGVSMATLSTTRARPPGSVLVTGLGPVGHLAAQMFRASGYRVTAVDPDPHRRQWLLDKGFADVHERLPASLAPEVVVECSGHEQAALDACRAVGRGGEVVLVGVPWKKQTELSAHAFLHEVFHRYVTLRSGWEWELPLHPDRFVGASTFGNLAGALAWLADRRVDVTDLYETVSPADAQRAYQDLLYQRASRLAVVFDWTRL